MSTLHLFAAVGAAKLADLGVPRRATPDHGAPHTTIPRRAVTTIPRRAAKAGTR